MEIKLDTDNMSSRDIKILSLIADLFLEESIEYEKSVEAPRDCEMSGDAVPSIGEAPHLVEQVQQDEPEVECVAGGDSDVREETVVDTPLNTAGVETSEPDSTDNVSVEDTVPTCGSGTTEVESESENSEEPVETSETEIVVETEEMFQVVDRKDGAGLVRWYMGAAHRTLDSLGKIDSDVIDNLCVLFASPTTRDQALEILNELFPTK